MNSFLKKIDRYIDGVTMYRVMLYTLGAISVWALGLATFNVLSFAWYELIVSFGVIMAGVLLAHYVCAKITKAPANLESSIITGLILFLILSPGITQEAIIMNALVAVFAVASKYIFVYRLRHIFNPVAIALVAAGLLGYVGVEWWVSSRYMLPVVLIAALVVIQKTDRWQLFLTYVVTSTLIAYVLFSEYASLSEVLSIQFLSWPTIFFAAFMLTEPLGLPATQKKRIIFALIVAVLGTVPFSFGVIHGTPELALIAANLFTLVADRPARYKLSLINKKEVGRDTYEYLFNPSYPVNHKAGQYLEWTLPHEDVDSRGIRRYLTIVTPPEKESVGFAVKHLPKQSSWKSALQKMEVGDSMFATGKAGDFLLKGKDKKVFIAGGIGITPFMSMVRSATEKGENLEATFFFCNNTKDERCFVDELESARSIGLDTVYVTTNEESGSEINEHEENGFITADMLDKRVEDWQSATFYISGPPGMVAAYESLLTKNGVSQKQIITDYFPGLA